jgi:NADH:ubiquinone oxidoreductase subunit 5 (subunit L)/multisubunit Na+/H+ antiporter MnhA subunit
MFGSVVTLISVLRTIDQVFLRESRKKIEKVYETRFEMVVPTLLLAAMCVVFGIFTHQFFIERLIYTSLPFHVPWFDFWAPVSASSAIVAAILLGMLLFIYGRVPAPVHGTRAFQFEGGGIAKT